MKINVILSTRNRAASLDRTLSGFTNINTQLISWKIIVVDNGSDDRTPQILQKYCELLPLTILEEKRPGKNLALNKALRIVDSEWIVFTDDDIIPDQMWLQELMNATSRWPQHSIFGGTITPLMPPNTPQWIEDIDENTKSIAFAKYQHSVEEGPIEFTPFGANLAIRSDIMAKFQYNENLGPKQNKSNSEYIMGGETDLLQRLKNQQFEFIYVPKAKVQHVIREDQLNFQWLCRRYYLAGRGYAHYQKLTCPFIFGVPYFIWIQRVTLSLRYFLHVFHPKAKKFPIAKQLFWCKGALSEYLKKRRS
ncbi:glycosyltransferase [Candidatus Uabimicrobium amorphum]|uniref:Glycosyl transferase n=1 Tax=Uabimicrobium amorphum TaxID=2596890 RepID=A0A5S9IHI1_UABAM|nr:glycosyltransferase [Candidatus Uabimicrobium amorphum]BBM81919.1 glycosyl transferase [Candidatus Uabimicrobium amorphum]